MRDNRTTFYVSCVLAVLSVFVSTFYVIVYKDARDFNLIIPILTMLGGIGCAALSFIGLINIGAIVLGLCDFAGMLVFLRINYPVVIDSDIMSGSITITPAIANLILVTASLLVISIASNVLAWQENDLF
jgi:hypothetical protein